MEELKSGFGSCSKPEELRGTNSWDYATALFIRQRLMSLHRLIQAISRISHETKKPNDNCEPAAIDGNGFVRLILNLLSVYLCSYSQQDPWK